MNQLTRIFMVYGCVKQKLPFKKTGAGIDSCLIWFGIGFGVTVLKVLYFW